MRLVAFDFKAFPGPVDKGRLEFGELTVLFGSNDAGKTRVLEAIASGAKLLESLTGGNRLPLPWSRFYVELSTADIGALLKFDPDAEPPPDNPKASPLERWWDHESPEQRDRYRLSRTFALEEPDQGLSEDAVPALLAYWCDDLAATGASRSVPIEMQLPLFPAPAQLPSRDPAWLPGQVTVALSTWLAHVRWAVAPAQEWAKPVRDAANLLEIGDPSVLIQKWVTWIQNPFIDEVDERMVPDLWHPEGPAAPTAASQSLPATACAHVGDLATRLLPSFVRDRYLIRVEPPVNTGSGASVRIVLVTRDGKHRFLHTDVADGLRLWVELAVLEAADAMRRIELNLRRALRQIDIEVDHRYYALMAGYDEAPEDLRRAINSYVQMLNATLMSPVDPPIDHSLGLASGFGVDLDPSDWMDYDKHVAWVATKTTRLEATRPRLFLIDEPERHLNPRLQRSAAKWLVDLFRTRGSQGVIATHSPAFLSADADTRFVEVRRTSDGSSEVRSFLPAELTAYSELARDLGLDRGELLTNTRVILFVEGRHDQAVLEEVFQARFFRAGIVVVPIAGHGKYGQIIEHDVLIRFTRARLAVAFDKLTCAQVIRLRDDPVFREECLRKSTKSKRGGELQSMAALMQSAAMNSRSVAPLALPVHDIFDALHIDVVRDQFSAYPARHEDARAAYAVEGQGMSRKQFYEKRYGVPNEIESYKCIAARMRQLNLISPELRDLAENVERFALEE